MSGKIADLIDAVRKREAASLAAIAALEVARSRVDYAEAEEREARRDLEAAYAREIETLTAALERLQLVANR
jgi:hypothetical protein